MTTESTNLTPLMKQYWEIKSLHPDKVLFFRMGDFFEMFHEDATIAAPILGIALTSRNKKGGDETPMCGMPHHSVSGPINKLLSHGHKVAICDQLEDPKLAKGLVKRGVTRILTPGMVYDVETLEHSKPHYIAAIDPNYLSFIDTSTGEFFYIQALTSNDRLNFIGALNVAEVVCGKEEIHLWQGLGSNITSTEYDHLLDRHELLGDEAPDSAKRLLAYVHELGGEAPFALFKKLEKRSTQGSMQIGITSLRHLEIFHNYKNEAQGSLFHAIDRTRTSAGARLFRQWVQFPLLDKSLILQRQEVVSSWRDRLVDTKRIREILSKMGDIERRLSRIVSSSCNGRDLLSLAGSLEAGVSALSLSTLKENAAIKSIADKIHSQLLADQPLSTKQGFLIQKGVSAELDEMINITTNSQEMLMQMEMREREKTGITSLKIRYNNVFGYYIEITNTHKDKVPSSYQRKQTLANAERYCTDELIDLERKVLSAQTKRSDLESELFESLRLEVLKQMPEMLSFSRACAELDVYTALAWLSIENRYVRPEFNDAGISMRASRHPVIEQIIKNHFIPNDIHLGSGECLLLTGPNMAGKSTIMRQVALTAMMAQMGSYVPAESASLPLFDAIFTRIGASDQLSEGLSTFMVEMTETAQILKAATGKSLVVLDEIGRGTSTFDGMCLAQSILEFLLSEKKCTSFFATHYHELSLLDKKFVAVKNAHMTVSERGGEIGFLHTLVDGPATQSYGIQVARLAGVPVSVTERAHQLLNEMQATPQVSPSKKSKKTEAPGQSQLSFMEMERASMIDKMVNEMKSMSIEQMTPIQAMNRLSEIQNSLKFIL